MEYLVHLVILSAIYVVAAWSLDLIVGRLGMFSMAHAAFLGIGAYTYALVRTHFAVNFVVALVLAAFLSFLFGIVSAKPAGRLRAEQAMLFTIAIQGIVTAFFLNLEPLTGGTHGIAGITPPKVPGMRSAIGAQAIVAGVVLLAGFGVFALVHRSAPGLAMRAVGEDELLARSVGIDTNRVRAIGFALSGATAGVAGALLAGYLRFIDPTLFNLNESIFLVTALLIGGSGNLVGPALGMVLALFLPELLRAVDVLSSIAGNLQKILFAVLLILLMRLRPQGLAGEVALR